MFYITCNYISFNFSTEFLNIALTFAMDDLHVLIKKTKELTNDKGEGGYFNWTCVTTIKKTFLH